MIKYLTSTQVQINYMFAILHQMLYTKICHPEAQSTCENSLEMKEVGSTDLFELLISKSGKS